MKAKWFNKMRAADRCPEKAGVGGSIPSLATTFSITSKLPDTPVYSNSFQLDVEDSPHHRIRRASEPSLAS